MEKGSKAGGTTVRQARVRIQDEEADGQVSMTKHRKMDDERNQAWERGRMK